ncbi:hypothetical protein BH23ACT10_BH23ACT10_15680 [soil metagenome]
MRDELRERFFTPFVLPVSIIGLLLLVGLSLSRVMLAVSELGASFIAFLVAGYIMAMAFAIEARKRIPARTLGVTMAIGLIGVLAAGAVAAAAGMRSLEAEHGGGEGGGGEGGGGEGGGGEGGEATNEPVFVAIDNDYESAPTELPVGEVELTLDNTGTIEHTVVFEELNDEKVLDATGGETDEATVTLEAGEITYYCDVPGHREGGMEGTLTVAEGAETGGGGGEASEASSDAGSEQASEGGGSSSEAASDGASET